MSNDQGGNDKFQGPAECALAASALNNNNYNDIFEFSYRPGLVGRGELAWHGLPSFPGWLRCLAGLGWPWLAWLPCLAGLAGGGGGPGPIVVSGLSGNYRRTIRKLSGKRRGKACERRARPAKVGARPANVGARPANVGARPAHERRGKACELVVVARKPMGFNNC